MKNISHGDTHEEAGDCVEFLQSTTRRWARAWNEAGIEDLRPGFSMLVAEALLLVIIAIHLHLFLCYVPT